ncbi:MAG TPA: DUF2079 domain-containing protein [Aeromicrobium sp.]|nr:DUF2079 domain-containing protein [Aeromicrobium sp.]
MTARRAVPFVGPLVWAVACGAAYATISLVRFARMEVASYDNAIFQQAIAGYAHGRWPIVPIKGAGFNLLGDHFSPAIALVAPFYRLFPRAETLLVAQAVLVALSVYVIASVALRTLGVRLGSLVAVTYGLSFGIQSALVAGFHEVAFGVPLLALAGAAFVESRHAAVVGWSLPLLLVKEDLGLTVAAIGVALLLVRQWRRGLLLVVTGAAGTALVLFVLIPWARADSSGYAYALGGDGGLGALGDGLGQKAVTLLLTLAVGGLVAIASPWIVVALPTLAWRFAADNDHYWGTGWHYSLALMPIVAIAAVDVLRRARSSRWSRPVGAVAMVAVTCLSVVPTPVITDPPVTRYLNPAAWRETERERAAERVLALIPSGAVVDSDIGLISHLVGQGRRVTWTGTQEVDGTPEWVVMDHDPASGISSPQSATDYAEQRYGAVYRTVLRAYPFEVARRVGAR